MFCSWLYLSRKFPTAETALLEKTTVYTLHGKRGLPLPFSVVNEGGKVEVTNQVALHPHTWPRQDDEEQLCVTVTT